MCNYNFLYKLEANTKGPREKLPHTITENQEYGWDLNRRERIDRSDKRFFRPIVTSEMVKVAAKTRDSKKDQFTGVPFKVR